jgi:transcriptional antiterminator RfaH
MMDQGTRMTWFLVQLKPNSYRIAERNLRRQAFRTFLPMQEQTSRRHGKFKVDLKPLFPGYLFVALDVASGSWHAVNSTQGVSKLVSFGHDPVPVPPNLVPELMTRCDERGKIGPPRGLKPGDNVKLTSGPFAEFVATIERIAPDQRVWVLLDLMGRTARLAVDADAVRAH